MVIGHITFVLLGARLALCTLHTRYRFVRAHHHVAARFWDETRAELVAVRGLLIFAQSHLQGDDPVGEMAPEARDAAATAPEDEVCVLLVGQANARYLAT